MSFVLWIIVKKFFKSTGPKSIQDNMLTDQLSAMDFESQVPESNADYSRAQLGTERHQVCSAAHSQV